jgi:hypothetical protein
MKRELFAGAGWAAFGVALWMWGARGAEPRPGSGEVRVGAAPEQVVVIAAPRAAGGAMAAPAAGAETYVARGRVTLETLHAAQAWRELEPGEDMAKAICRAASAAGRAEWYKADWNLDGVLDGADVESFAAAFNARSLAADLNHDGRVDGLDFAEFLREFREGERRVVEAC